MKRKVIQLAGRTYVVSLPAQWVKKYNIKKGDDINVEESSNKIIISTSEDVSCDKVSVDLTGSLPMTKRILGALYKGGYDEISATFSGDAERIAIEDVVKDAFIGFEISYEGKNNVVIKEISKADYEKFEDMLKRVFLIVKTMGQDSLQALKSNDKALLAEIIKRDWDVNRLTDFCRRIVNKKGYMMFKKSPPIYFIVEEIEKIADCYKEMCKSRLSSQVKMDKELERFFNEVNGFFAMFFSIFYKFEIKSTIEFGKKRDEIAKLGNDLKPSEGKIVAQLKNILDLTFDMNGALIAAKL